MSSVNKWLCLGLAIFLMSLLSVPPARGQGPEPVTMPEIRLATFADVPSFKKDRIKPNLKDVAATVDKAVNYNEVQEFLGIGFSPAQKEFLNRHKFLLIPKSATRYKGQINIYNCLSEEPWDEMLAMFDSICGEAKSPLTRRPENARLVTPDVMLHGFHKYFENSLEYLETVHLSEQLYRFLQKMTAKALEYQKASGGPLAERYEIIAAQMTVPLIVLQNAGLPFRRTQPRGSVPPTDNIENAIMLLEKFDAPFSKSRRTEIENELRLIYKAGDMTVSPLFGRYSEGGLLKSDYTQFTPRSHYTKSPVLRGYFRAMIYLGRHSYLLNHPEGITDALLIAHLLSSTGKDGRPIIGDWQAIMEITGFYAGASDDISFPEWRDFLVQVLGKTALDPSEAVEPAVIEKITAQLGRLRPPRILSDAIIGEMVLDSTKGDLLESTKSFRIFGQRFTFDGWILNRLTAGQEVSPDRLPSTPSALFVPAAFGQNAAREMTGQWLEKQTPPFSEEERQGFFKNLDEMGAVLAKEPEKSWFASMNAAWLKLIDSLTDTFGQGYPLYMQSDPFPLKQLQTYLGSFTQLRHDTLLYAKQSYAEMGNGEEDEGQPPPAPRGFIEPNLRFWYELQRLVDYTLAGFANNHILEIEIEKYGRLSQFKRQVDFYTSLAEKELQGIPLTEDEYEQLRVTNISYIAEPFTEDYGGLPIMDEKDKRSALIADIHTDVLQGQILYEATGEPYIMLVLVGNEGLTRLTIGVAFNHYEFTDPIQQRLTDEAWQKTVYEEPDKLPGKNFWYQGLDTD